MEKNLRDTEKLNYKGSHNSTIISHIYTYTSTNILYIYTQYIYYMGYISTNPNDQQRGR